jgi:hypothetical protein
MASEQDFDRILTYRAEPASIEKTVECVFSESRFETIRLPHSVSEITRRSGGYVSFQWDGLIHYSPAGLVFGLLPLLIE